MAYPSLAIQPHVCPHEELRTAFVQICTEEWVRFYFSYTVAARSLFGMAVRFNLSIYECSWIHLWLCQITHQVLKSMAGILRSWELRRGIDRGNLQGERRVRQGPPGFGGELPPGIQDLLGGNLQSPKHYRYLDHVLKSVENKNQASSQENISIKICCASCRIQRGIPPPHLSRPSPFQRMCLQNLKITVPYSHTPTTSARFICMRRALLWVHECLAPTRK